MDKKTGQRWPAWALFLAQHKAAKEAGIETDPLLDDLIRAAMTYGVNRGHAHAAEVLGYLSDVNARVKGKPRHRPPGKTAATQRIEEYVAFLDGERGKEGKEPLSAAELADSMACFNNLIPSMTPAPSHDALKKRIIRARAAGRDKK